MNHHDKKKLQILVPWVVIAGAIIALGYSAFMPHPKSSMMRQSAPPSPPSPPSSIPVPPSGGPR